MMHSLSNMALKCYLIFSIFIIIMVNYIVSSHSLPYARSQTDYPKSVTSYLLKQLLKRNTRSLYKTIDSDFSKPVPKSEELKMPNCSLKVKKSYHLKTAKAANRTPISCDPEQEIESIECMAEEFCKDAETPEDRVWHCKPKIILREKCVPDSSGENYSKIYVQIEDGCECKLELKRNNLG